ncbi:MAG: TlpA family protein disulfide reductase [Thermoleophilaceae bacterium]|nr:TlpA family protein disulfide reductase [Thermoleophilaceae bacterium]
MGRKRVLWSVAAAALVAVVAIGLATAGTGSGPSRSAAPSRAVAEKRLAGSPPALAALHAQASRLLPGGVDAFEKRLEQLRGHPVVVNKWASWCGPCRAEFPEFQQASVEHGRKVAFIGVNSSDNDGAAKRFLAQFPVSYPSYSDGDGRIAEKIRSPGAFPTTTYFDSQGRRVGEHIGVYRSRGELEADIRRYAR